MTELAEFKPVWIEEPTSPDDVLAHKNISEVFRFISELIKFISEVIKYIIYVRGYKNSSWYIRISQRLYRCFKGLLEYLIGYKNISQIIRISNTR